MKKVWNTPELETLNVNATAYNPNGGEAVDGTYISTDGKYVINTYAPSSGNAGTPGVSVNK